MFIKTRHIYLARGATCLSVNKHNSHQNSEKHVMEIQRKLISTRRIWREWQQVSNNDKHILSGRLLGDLDMKEI